MFAAQIATVGLNPSDQEYLDPHGGMLAGAKQRFATLASLGAADRTLLTDQQADEAIEWMRGYYEHGKPVYGWFSALNRVAEAFGLSFQSGGVVHLDLVQEATKPTWSRLPSEERESLLALDLPFLEWQIRTFPLRAVICTSKTVGTHVMSRLGVEVEESGTLARIKWWIGAAGVGGRQCPSPGGTIRSRVRLDWGRRASANSDA